MATRIKTRGAVASTPTPVRLRLPSAIATFLLAAAATCGTAHAEWDFTPRARIGGDYSDNRNLARPPQKETNDWLATAAVGGQLEYFSPTASAWIEPIVMYRHYGSEEHDDSVVGQVLMNSQKSTERTTWRLNGEYELFDSVMSQLPGAPVDAPTDPNGGDPDIDDPNSGDSGNVENNNDRERLWLNPSVDYRFSESSSMRLALQSQRVRYDEPSPNNSDYDDDAVFLTYLHRLSPRTRINVTATASTYESLQLNNNVDTVGAFGQVRRTVSESMWMGFLAGLYRSETDFGDPLVKDTTDNGWEAGVEFGGNTELSIWEVHLGQSLVPSSSGLPVERTELRLTWEHNFTERFSGDVGLRAFHNAPQSSSINKGDRDYLWSMAQVSWQWTPTLTLSLGGTYRQQEYEVDTDSSNATSVFLNLEYQGLGRAQD